MFDIVKNAVEENVNVNINEWKRLVREKIWERQNQRFSIVCKLSKTLSLIGTPVVSKTCLSWWKYVQSKPHSLFKCRTLIRLLLDCHELNSCKVKYKGSNVNSSMCNYCQKSSIEDVQHVLFECTAKEPKHDQLWSKVLKTCPSKLEKELMMMNSHDKTAFLLTGLNNSYMEEWVNIFEAVLDFVYETYLDHVLLHRNAIEKGYKT